MSQNPPSLAIEDAIEQLLARVSLLEAVMLALAPGLSERDKMIAVAAMEVASTKHTATFSAFRPALDAMRIENVRTIADLYSGMINR